MPKTDDTSAPLIPTGEELYDRLMAEIEPELLTKNLPTLDEKYKGESPEDAKVRADRYDKAFAEYEKRLAEYMGSLKGKVNSYRRTAMQSAEAEDRVHDTDILKTLESKFGA